jgi:hypothetical protein
LHDLIRVADQLGDLFTFFGVGINVSFVGACESRESRLEILDWPPGFFVLLDEMPK